MITLFAGCILAGCMQDVPVVITRDPVMYHIRSATQRKPKPPKMACYVEGVFYVECPK